MVYHRIRCSPRKHTITYIVRNVGNLGDLVIKEVLQNNPENDYVLAYADDIAQTATSFEKLQERMTRWNESFNRYNLKLRPILLYGHESWILTKKLKSKITAADMKVLRLLKGVTRRDRVRNADIHAEFKIKQIRFCHVMRRDQKTTENKVLHLKVKRKIV